MTVHETSRTVQMEAQQDRPFDVSVLVPSRSRLQVPVSCVEAGRWEAKRHGEAFQAGRELNELADHELMRDGRWLV